MLNGRGFGRGRGSHGADGRRWRAAGLWLWLGCKPGLRCNESREEGARGCSGGGGSVQRYRQRARPFGTLQPLDELPHPRLLSLTPLPLPLHAPIHRIHSLVNVLVQTLCCVRDAGLHLDYRALEVRDACLQRLNLVICVAVGGGGDEVGRGVVYGVVEMCGAFVDAMDEVGPWTKAGGEGEEGGVEPGERVGT